MLEVKNVTKTYGEGEARIFALSDVSLKVDRGDFKAIMGPSGSGKSTLLNIIGGLDSLSSGEVILEGRCVNSLNENALVDIRRGKIAYVFQQYHLLPSLTALENVLLPLMFGEVGVSIEKALDILRRVGLEKRVGHQPSQLSGGEQQRVAIARALVKNPPLILADEPTGNLDSHSGAEIISILTSLHTEQGITLVMITHDADVAHHCQRIIHLKDGQVEAEEKL